MAIKVLLISHERKMGGANHSLAELAEQLKKKGNDVTVAVLYHGCPIDKRLQEMGFRTIAVPFGWWQQPSYWNGVLKAIFRVLHGAQWFSSRYLAHYVKKHGIQVIHSNSSVIDIGAQTAALAGCKHVWHFREFGAEDYRLEYMLGRKWSLQYVATNSDVVIFISEALKQSYADLPEGVAKYVIYDGIVGEEENSDWENVLGQKMQRAVQKELPPKEQQDSGVLIRQEDTSQEQQDGSPLKQQNIASQKEAASYTFLVTGNISEGKNQHLVLEAAHILQQNCAGKNVSNDYAVQDCGVNGGEFRILFAGAPTSLAESKEYQKKLEEDCRKWNLEDHVSFLGYVEDMLSLRRQVNAEIVPSKCEAYGRVTLEAMKSGNLVIASDAGANPELLGAGGAESANPNAANQQVHGESTADTAKTVAVEHLGGANVDNVNVASRGLLFRLGDVADLAKKMQWAMEHATDYHIQERAYRYVFEAHRREEACGQIRKIYEQIVST